MTGPATTLRALTLTQPWASLVAVGAKRVETRSWPTRHRGPLAIHAAKGLASVGGKRGLRDLCLTEPFLSALGDWRDSLLATYRGMGAERVHGTDGSVLEDGPAGRLPLGAIVAVCDVLDVMPVEEERDALEEFVANGDLDRADLDRELALGNWEAGRYAWVLGHVVALPAPIVCGGALGLWRLPPHVEAYCRGVADSARLPA